MGSKLNLTWANFQANINKSLDLFKSEHSFCDVTLISDDQQLISAHRVVLAASSEFFKNILIKAFQPNTFLYISGVSSEILHNIVTYLYKGEVELHQTDLDSFLSFAQKLKIEGLMKDQVEAEDRKNNKGEVKSEPQEIKLQSKKYKFIEEKDVVRESYSFENANESTDQQGQKRLRHGIKNKEHHEKQNRLIIKHEDGKLECTECGRNSEDISNMRKHVEKHISDISYDCKYCGNAFKSRSSLYSHHNKECGKNNKDALKVWILKFFARDEPLGSKIKFCCWPNAQETTRFKN